MSARFWGGNFLEAVAEQFILLYVPRQVWNIYLLMNIENTIEVFQFLNDFDTFKVSFWQKNGDFSPILPDKKETYTVQIDKRMADMNI